MKFHSPLTNYTFLRRQGLKQDPKEFYTQALALAHSQDWTLEKNNIAVEHNWYQDQRPYYNIWPGIIPLLTSLKLDLDGALIKPLRGSIAFCLPELSPLTFEDQGETWPVKTILASPSLIRHKPGFSLFIDINETGPGGAPVNTVRSFQTVGGQTIEESIESLPHHESETVGIITPPEILANCVKIVCGICLLDQGDSDLIQACVLNKDAEKYSRTGDPKYINKARKRGKVGWDIGKSIERAPHFRRAHLAIYWTGPGRKIPIVKLRGADKPIIVHRDKVETLPTDFLDKGPENASRPQ